MSVLHYRCGCGAMGRDDVPLKTWDHAPGCNMLSLDITLTEAARMLIASIEEDDDER